MDFQLTGSRYPEVRRWAYLSPCGMYRYVLTRSWAEGSMVVWVMLNPSTADARVDDPTIRKVMGFSRRWGYAGCVVVNLFGLRATDPKALREAADPYGPENGHTVESFTYGRPVIAAWGDSGGKLTDEACERLPTLTLQCLGTTKAGNPRHPCRLAYETPLEPWPF